MPPHRASIEDLLARGHLKPGDVLVLRQRVGVMHKAVVTSGGELRLESGVVHRPPREAGGYGTVDGWHKWRLSKTNQALHHLRGPQQ
jgi:hypothetical protein